MQAQHERPFQFRTSFFFFVNYRYVHRGSQTRNFNGISLLFRENQNGAHAHTHLERRTQNAIRPTMVALHLCICVCEEFRM